MLNSITIRAKILVLVGLLLTGILVLSAVGILGVREMRQVENNLHDQGFGPAEQSLILHKHLYKLRGDIYKLLLLPDESEKIRDDIQLDMDRIDSVAANLEALAPSLTDSVRDRISSTISSIKEYKRAVLEISNKSKDGDLEFGKSSLKTGQAHLARRNVDVESGALLRLVEAEVVRIDSDASVIGSKTYIFLCLFSVLLFSIGLVGSISLVRQIVKPIGRIVKILNRLADGDFREEGELYSGSGEIAEMAHSLARLRSRLQGAFQAINSSSQSAMESSKTLLAMTQKLASEADANEHEAQSAATVTEEASETLRTISGGASQSMSSLESVSAAIEEMSSSVAEIARSADQTRAMTTQALKGAKSASSRMEELAVASKEIESVIEMIVEISEQTKLLALNATIEAARAGEAGKGFAVVAGEVKELAKGTSEATEDIRKRVEAIRSTTNNAVLEISTVTGNMETLGMNISSIAGAVEEQSATTREISRNIGEAVQGTRKIHRNLEAGSKSVAEINHEIQSVLARGKVLREIASTATESSQRSEQLSQELAAEVHKFRV